MNVDKNYKILADLLPQIVFEIDKYGIIKYANREAFNTFGYTQDEFDEGLNGIQMFIPENRDRIEESISRILNGEKLDAVEFTAVRKNGTTFPALAYGVPKTQDDEPVGVTGIIVDISERKQAEEELQRKEEHFRALIENSSDAIAIIGANGILYYRGSSVEDVLGVAAQDRIGTSGFDFVHPDDLPKAADLFEQLLLKPNSVVHAEVRAQHQNGSWRILDITGKNLLDNPAVGGIVANFRDITERKQIENALRESEEKLRIMFDTIGEGMTITDLEGRLIDLNETAFKRQGYNKKEEMIGKSSLEIIAEKDRERALRDIAKGFQGEHGTTLQYTLKSKDGREYDVEATGAVLHDNSGNPTGYINVTRDITERKKAEETLKESEEKFRTIFENANDIIVYVDIEGRIIDANSKIEEVGYKREEVIGREFLEFEIFKPKELQKSLALFKDRVNGKYGDITEFEIFKKDGTKLFVEVNSKSIERDGVVHGVINIVRDITERKQAVEALKTAYDDVENQVKQRTAELAESNKQLQKEIVERERAEEELKRSEERFRMLIENSSDGIVLLDGEGSVAYSSPSGGRIIGYEPDEWIGTPWFEFIHPDDLQNITEVFNNLANNPGSSATLEVRYKHRDGSWRWLNGIGNNFLDDPRINGIVTNYRDTTERRKAEEETKRLNIELMDTNAALEEEITERKQVEEALKESEEKYRLVAENSDDLIALTTLDGTYLYVSPSHKKLGYESKDLIGTSGIDIVQPEDKNLLLSQFQQSLQQGSTITTEYRIRDKWENWHLIETTSNYVTNESGKKVSIVHVARDITERNKAEEALRESEEKFRTIFEDASDEIIYLDETGTILDVNKRIEDVWGYKREEVVGKNFGEFNYVLPESYPDISEKLMEAFDDETPIVAEIKGSRKDGTVLLTEASGRVIRLSDGRKAVLVIVRDITERRQAEDALRESEEKYREVVERSNDGIVIIQDGIAKFANARMGEIIGYDTQEGLDRPFSDFIDPDELPSVARYYEQRMAGDAVPTIYETILMNKNGNKVFIEFSGGLVAYEGNPAVLGFVRDITNRKKADEALKDSEERYRDLFESAPASITVLDASGVILDCNETTGKLVGYPRDEIIGQPFDKLLTLDPKDIPKLAEVYENMVKGMEVGPLELEIIRSDGERRWIRTVNSLLMNGTEVVGFQIFAMDITERKRDEDQLQIYTSKLKDMNEELSHYAYVASHDIGAPLRVIRLNTHLLRKELANTSFQDNKDHLKKIDDSVAESLQLAQNLLDLSRLGERELLIEPIDVGALVQKVIASSGLPPKVNIIMDDNWPTVNSNSILLTQIFRNLIDNAVKFNKKPVKRVELQWRIIGKDDYEFSVKDNGIGIAARQHGDVFKVFKQLHLKEEYKGTGIGLAIVKKAVNTLGGSVRVESKAGRGSTFYASIPKNPRKTPD